MHSDTDLDFSLVFNTKRKMLDDFALSLVHFYARFYLLLTT